MNIIKQSDGKKYEIRLEGRLDTITAPKLEKEMQALFRDAEFGQVNMLVFDFEKLAYISSAGLRVILMTQKQINKKQGKMIIKNANEIVMEVFEVTGFIDILTIE